MLPRLLVADDDPSITTMLEILLGKQFEVVSAPDGKRALALLRESSFAGAILDWMMPGLTGLEVLEHVRATPAVATLPVMILTARNDHEAEVAARRAGVDSFVTKPFDPAMVASLATMMVAGGTPRRTPMPEGAANGASGTGRTTT